MQKLVGTFNLYQGYISLYSISCFYTSFLFTCTARPEFSKNRGIPGLRFIIFLFSILLIVNKSADYWIQTTDHGCPKRPHYQLCHNQCPTNGKFFSKMGKPRPLLFISSFSIKRYTILQHINLKNIHLVSGAGYKLTTFLF